MDKTTAKQRITDLIHQLNQWNREYYLEDNPSVPDYVYDQAMAELKQLEQTYPELLQADSPTQRVGGGLNQAFQRVKHLAPMLSLQNAFDDQDLWKFAENVTKIVPKAHFVTEPKIDGLSISLVYKEGQLKMALTRGNGQDGENVLDNVLTIPNIPRQIPYLGTCEIRGEVYMDRQDFDRLNQHLEKKFANPRNAAAGTLRNIDPTVAQHRHLQALFYYIPQWREIGLETHWEVLTWLKNNHFQVAEQARLWNNFGQVIQEIAWWNEHRKEMPYQIDGVVIKTNENTFYEAIGTTAKFPKWAIAYKFPALVGCTRVRQIVHEVGRTGKITYVGVLDPILLDGSTISSVTLNNASYIQEKQLHVNDDIYIYKAGDVIPYFDQVAHRPENEIPFQKATNCPSCGQTLVEEGAEQFCFNPECPEQHICQLIYLCSKECLDIKGLSDKTVRKFYQLGFLRSPLDLFRLKEHQEEIYQLPLKIKAKTMGKILQEINQAKEKPLERWLNAFSIRHLGKVTAQKLARTFSTIEALMSASEADLEQIPDVGIAIATEVFTFWQNPQNQILVQMLRQAGVKFVNPLSKQGQETEQSLVTSPWKDKVFVITGSFEQPREELETMLSKRYGIKFAHQVSKKTDYLLVGKNPGSKLKEAMAKGIPTIKEEFWTHE